MEKKKYKVKEEKIGTKVIDWVFKDARVKYGLEEFKEIDIPKQVKVFEKEPGRFYVRCLKRDKDIFVFDKNTGKGKPEEIIRQLWLRKLRDEYKYPLERIELEKSISFGREIKKKSADIVVYQKDKITPYIIFELKQPNAKEGIEQLKSYLSAEGAPLGVWSNGKEKIILYRPYPKEFVTTLSDIPRVDQTIDDLFGEKKTLDDLTTEFDLAQKIKNLEELVLANAGVDVFNEVFKLIYAKLFDEKEARDRRKGEVLFRLYKEAEKTYGIINDLFKEAIQEWPGIFNHYEKIELSPTHLQICVGDLEEIKLFGSDLEIIDAAFEYLLPGVAKGKKGQYFTPRHVIKMAVKMLNPKENEYVIDPGCGSGGFLIHAMFWGWENYLKEATWNAKTSYANRYLYGIDFDDKMAKISRALMLIAGDGRSHIFKLNALDPRDWQGEEEEKLAARKELKPLLHKFNNVAEDKENEKNWKYLDFDLLLTNPPFAGEIRDTGILRQYFLTRDKKGHLKNKVERHLLFVERALEFLRPGGRMAIVLPQGVLNNTNMEYIREWLLEKARILAVVGLHVNTFKPHTGTKTSLLFLQKWNDNPDLGPLCQYQKDYPIFMATSKKPGKDNSGNYVYKKDKKGNYILDKKGRRILDHDLDEIADKFLEFAKKEGFSFWSK